MTFTELQYRGGGGGGGGGGIKGNSALIFCLFVLRFYGTVNERGQFT